MLFRRKTKDYDIGPLRGWGKFFHRLGRFLLLPLRRPVATLVVLLILFLAPTFRGVKPINVHKWYGVQIVSLWKKALIWWGSDQQAVTPGSFKFKPEENAPAPVVMKKVPVPEEKNKNVPNILDVLTAGKKQVDKPIAPEPKETSAEIERESAKIKGIRLPKDEKLYAYPQDKKVHSLKYLDFPHEIVGKAIVHNSNEIEIDGEFILMYGVYVHPYTARGVSATEYLKQMIEGKEVKCGIVAYTDQNIATGICYYNNENLNRSMVINGYTRNVAL